MKMMETAFLRIATFQIQTDKVAMHVGATMVSRAPSLGKTPFLMALAPQRSAMQNIPTDAQENFANAWTALKETSTGMVLPQSPIAYQPLAMYLTRISSLVSTATAASITWVTLLGMVTTIMGVVSRQLVTMRLGSASMEELALARMVGLWFGTQTRPGRVVALVVRHR